MKGRSSSDGLVVHKLESRKIPRLTTDSPSWKHNYALKPFPSPSSTPQKVSALRRKINKRWPSGWFVNPHQTCTAPTQSRSPCARHASLNQPMELVCYLCTNFIQRLWSTSQGNRLAGLFLAHTALQERIRTTPAAQPCPKQWSRDVRSACRLLLVKATYCELYLLDLKSGQLQGESGRLQLLRDWAYVLLRIQNLEKHFLEPLISNISWSRRYSCAVSWTRTGLLNTAARRTHCRALVYSWNPRPLVVSTAQDPHFVCRSSSVRKVTYSHIIPHAIHPSVGTVGCPRKVFSLVHGHFIQALTFILRSLHHPLNS
jgi:hypothetical protein